MVPQYGTYLASFCHQELWGWSQFSKNCGHLVYTNELRSDNFWFLTVQKTLPKTVIPTSTLTSVMEELASPGRSNTAY